LKQRLRLRREEREEWSLAEVEYLLSQWWAQPPLFSIEAEPKRLRIVTIDPALPLIPKNARIDL